MNLSTELVAALWGALVGGVLALITTVIGAIAAYCFALRLEAAKHRAKAVTEFRDCFAEGLGLIYIARNHGTHNTPLVADQIRNMLPQYAAAVEKFRPLATDGEAFQSAWENFRQFANQDTSNVDTAEWGHEPKLPTWATLEKHMRTLQAEGLRGHL